MRPRAGEPPGRLSRRRCQRVEQDMVTEEEWSGEVAKSKRFRLLSPIIALGAFGLVFVPCMAAGNAIASGFAAYLVSVGLVLAIMFPIAFVLVSSASANNALTDEKVRNLNTELTEAIAAADREAVIRDSQVQRQRFESRLANALDMAEGEPEVIDVIERSFGAVLPDAPAELLLADNSHAHLLRMAAVGPDGEPPSCGVDSPDRCPAARRAQIQDFPDSDHLDACPKLRNRPQGRLSALCVPVSIMGRTVGVIHATGEPGSKVEDDRVDDLATLAKLAGCPHRPAAGHGRDAIAGVDRHAHRAPQPPLLLRAGRRPCRRISIPSPWPWPTSTTSRRSTTPTGTRRETGPCGCSRGCCVTRCGPATSSRATAVRSSPSPSRTARPIDATRALNTVRAQLDAAITVGGLPKFTASFGVTEAEPGEELVASCVGPTTRCCMAKRQGRDRVVLHDAAGTVGGADERGPFRAVPERAPLAGRAHLSRARPRPIPRLGRVPSR